MCHLPAGHNIHSGSILLGFKWLICTMCGPHPTSQASTNNLLPIPTQTTMLSHSSIQHTIVVWNKFVRHEVKRPSLAFQCYVTLYAKYALIHDSVQPPLCYVILQWPCRPTHCTLIIVNRFQWLQITLLFLLSTDYIDQLVTVMTCSGHTHQQILRSATNLPTLLRPFLRSHSPVNGHWAQHYCPVYVHWHIR